MVAGQLSALLPRRLASDQFNCINLLRLNGLDRERLHRAFIVYGSMSRKDWTTVTLKGVDFDIADLEQRIPALGATRMGKIQKDHFGEGLVEDCRNFLTGLLPFTEAEHG